MIFHITTEEVWTTQLSEEKYITSDFNKESFIHCCLEEQVAGVLFRYFKNKTDLIKISIDEGKLMSEVKYEKGPTGELFPHVYGAINKDAIVSIEKL